MDTMLQRNYRAQEDNRTAILGVDIKLGLIGGLVGSLVMELVLIVALTLASKPPLTCLSFVGDTVAHLIAKFGLNLPGGVPMCLAAQYLIGAIFGVIFCTGLSTLSTWRINSLKKGIFGAVIYSEILSQPILAMTTILLKMSAKDTLLWYAASFMMHFWFGVALGAIVCYGKRHTS